MLESQAAISRFSRAASSFAGPGRRDVADRLQQALVVEPIDPFEGLVLDGLAGLPRAEPVDDLGLEQSDHALGEGIVMAVADAADGRLDAGLRQPLRVADADLLRSAVAVVDQALGRPASMQRLLQGVEHEARRWVPADPPADDPPGEGVDHEGDVDHAGPGAHVGEVRDPQLVRRRGHSNPGRIASRNPMELPVDQIERASRRLVGYGRSHGLAAHHAFQPETHHQPRDAVTADLETFSVELQPDLLCAVDAEVLLVRPDDLHRQPLVLLRPPVAPRAMASGKDTSWKPLAIAALLYIVYTRIHIPALEVPMAQVRTSGEDAKGRSLINLRITSDDRRLIDRAAATTGKNRSEFMLEAAREAAQEALLDKLLFRVDAQTFDQLQADLQRPPAASEGLRKLMQTKAPWQT